MTKQFVIYVVDFDPIEILTHLAPQNDCQHLNFVKDIYVVGKKMARNGCKMANAYCCDLYTASDYKYPLVLLKFALHLHDLKVIPKALKAHLFLH